MRSGRLGGVFGSRRGSLHAKVDCEHLLRRCECSEHQHFALTCRCKLLRSRPIFCVRARGRLRVLSARAQHCSRPRRGCSLSCNRPGHRHPAMACRSAWAGDEQCPRGQGETGPTQAARHSHTTKIELWGVAPLRAVPLPPGTREVPRVCLENGVKSNSSVTTLPAPRGRLAPST